ncbi:Polysaccharide biosynthesis protein [Sphingobacterium spiritivorum]|uniref:Polysaccharide biosynthesis protein n=1 Tax=Sphingobacterium spiritivorum TaxID=258 RepID=A0A380C5A9_SPHSI|nr:oligosaccharide flippase family protein [Sphingobacterium spiritivorum]SUJ13095.1 Polysaccharide biosynthesis protein [Sphingobacterium spiritivorum]
MIKNKLFSDTILYALGEVFPRIISLLLLPLFTAYLTPADYGILSYTSAFVMFLYVFSTLSLNSYVLRFYFEYETEIERKRLIGNVFVFVGLFNLLLLGIFYFILPIVISFFSIQVPWNPYFRLAIITNFLEVFTIIPMVIFRVRQQAVYFVMLSITRVVLQFALVYYFVVIKSIGLLGSYYGQLIPLCIYFFVSWGIILKNAIINVNMKQIKEGLKFSLPLLPGAVAYLIMSLSDRIILERHVSLSIIGVYNVAVTFSQSLNIAVQSGYRALEPEIFKRFNQIGFSNFVKKSSDIFLTVVYILAIGLAIFSHDVFYLLTSKNFHSGSELVPYIVIGILFAAHNVIFSSLLSAEKDTKSIGLSTLVGGVISLSVNFILVPRIGVYASIIASAIAFLVMNCMLFAKIRTRYSIFSSAKCMFIYAIVICIMAIWNPPVSFETFSIKLLLLAVGAFAVCTVTNIKMGNFFERKT